MLELLAQADYNYTYTTTSTNADAGAAAAIMAFMVAWMIVVIPILVFGIVCMWKVFTKAGQEGWKSIVPFYNGYVLAEISGKPGWWALVGLLGVIPIIGIIASIASFVLYILIAIELAKSFGKDTGFAVLLILLPIVGFAMLAFGDAKYIGPGGKAKGSKPAAA